MKGLLVFELSRIRQRRYFQPIRNKSDVIRILLDAVMFMRISKPSDAQGKFGNLVLKIEKMSRLFFYHERHIFSIHFPFRHYKLDDINDITNRFSSRNGTVIDGKMNEDLLSFFGGEEEVFDSSDYAEIATRPLDMSDGLLSVIQDLIAYESGYLRYDFDAENENGKLHPLNHLDVFYSNGARFKLGLKDEICINDLIDILNLNTDCRFLVK